VLGIINPIARVLTLFLVWTNNHYCINEIIVLHTHPFVVNRTINATPLERLQQHPLLFLTCAITVCQVPDHREEVRTLCFNFYRRRDPLSDCKSDKDVSQCVHEIWSLFGSRACSRTYSLHTLQLSTELRCWEYRQYSRIILWRPWYV